MKLTASSDSKVNKDEPPQSSPFWISWRFAISVIGFFGFVNVYAQRVGMSVAIVCMVNHTALQLEKIAEANEQFIANNRTDIIDDGRTVVDTIGKIPHKIDSINKTFEENYSEPSKCSAVLGSTRDTKNGPFVWDKEIQGHILGAFFYGYLVSQIPAGVLAERFGAKWIFAASFSICTICTILSPLAASLGYGYLIAIRVISGLGSGASYPAMHVLWSKWAPPMERSKLANICYAGSWMGNVIALPLSGYLCQNGFAGGWPSVFYVVGISSFCWLILWVVFVTDSPTQHRIISVKERNHIVNSLKGQVSNVNRKDKIPWCSVIKSGPVWAIVLAGITSDWGLYTFLTNIPTYMYEVLRFDIKSNGLYSALPFIGMWANMNISPIIGDKLRSSGVISTGITRKLFFSIGSFGAAAFLIGLAFVDCEHPLTAVILLSLGITISGSVYTGYFVNQIDIAPQFAGTLMGLGNGIAACTGFIAPYTVAVLTTNQTHGEWQTVFFLSAGIYVFGAIAFNILSSGEIQEWAKETVNQSEEDVELQKKLTNDDHFIANGHHISGNSVDQL